jgi:hypothetical protein
VRKYFSTCAYKKNKYRKRLGVELGLELCVSYTVPAFGLCAVGSMNAHRTVQNAASSDSSKGREPPADMETKLFISLLSLRLFNDTVSNVTPSDSNMQGEKTACAQLDIFISPRISRRPLARLLAPRLFGL